MTLILGVGPSGPGASGTVLSAASAGDTWGIDGPTFAGLYLLALATVTAVFYIARQSLLGPPAGPPPGGWPVLPREDLAYLSGGLRRAVDVAVISLNEQGLLARAGRVDGTMHVVGAPAPGTISAFEQAVGEAVARTGRARSGSLAVALAAHPAVTAMRERLLGIGALASQQRATTARRVAWLYVALLAVGIARAAVGASRHHPVGFLVIEMLATALAAAVGAASVRYPAPSQRGRTLLSQAQEGSTALRSGGLPGQRALAVALFGPAALWAADQELARHLGFSSPTSGSDGGGGGCGGGGCGGGCGG